MSSLSEMQPFWMVFGIGRRGPAYQHRTEAEAERECERLARQSPGTTFVVLEATKAVKLREFETFDLRKHPAASGRDAIEDDIPF